MASRVHDGVCRPCTLCKKSSTRYTHIHKLPDKKYHSLCQVEKKETIDKNACICHACFKQIIRNTRENFQPRWRPKVSSKGLCSVENCKKTAHRRTSLGSASEIATTLEVRLTSFQVGDSDTKIPLCHEHYSEFYESAKRNSLVQSLCEGKSLEDISAALLKSESRLNERGENITVNEFFELVLSMLSQTIVNSMRQNEALLLPNVYEKFRDIALQQANKYPHINILKNNLPSVRWLLSRLHETLGSNLVLECRHKCVGTMLLYKHCDTLTALSNALGKLNRLQRHTQTPNEQKQAQVSNHIDTCQDSIIMAAQHLNKRLHQQAKAFTNRFKQKPQEILEMNLSTLVESADQTLMGFIQELTKPIRDSKRVLFDENQPHEGISQEKQIKHFYALCLLLFNTNTMCTMPFHFTLTEAILCHGGSSELVNLFNKLGIVSSLDTNNRIATSIVEMRTKEGIKPLLSQGALSIISIDNVDILQPHAIVSSLDATRSWHGTSVQCIQPLPQSTQLTEEEKATTTSAGDDQPQSPIPVQPSKRRRRTLMECSLPHTELATPPRDEETYRNIMEGLYTHKEKCYLTKNHFIQQTTDLYSIHQLKEDIFKAMLLKYYKSRQGTSITPHHLPSLPILVHGVRKQTSDTEVSNVVYVDVLSERADCSLFSYCKYKQVLFLLKHSTHSLQTRY